MTINNKEIEIIEPTELAGKTVVIKEQKKFYYNEPFNYKVTGINSNYNDSLFYKLFVANNDNYFLFIEYLIRYMDKNNIINIDKEKIQKYLSVSERTIYRWLKALVSSDLLVKISKNKYMVNPRVIINYRKTKNNKLLDLIKQYNYYKSLLKE